MIAVLWLMALAAAPGAAAEPAPAPAAGAEPAFWDRLKASVENHLGRPYVWGATGLKSFDCSGFVWRVYFDSGVMLKRTTARKLYFSLPAPPQNSQYSFGNLVFFDDLKHVGIVDSHDTFYHAEYSTGTSRSRFDPYWRKKVVGVRAGPAPRGAAAKP
jgi:cell wall-associated NlpC family hydrolase